LAAQGHDNDPDGTGVTFTIEPYTSPRITFLLQDVTLFEAVTAVAEQFGLSVCATRAGLFIYRKKE
jgi:hypothetical protein